MFERLTERTRQVMFFAQEEARRFGHDFIGTEHILLGLLREEKGLSAHVLQSHSITDERVGTRLGGDPWVGEQGVDGPIPFTPRATRALELACVEADALHRETTSTHHLLLGLLRVADGGAVRLLLELGARPRQLREQVLANLSTAPAEWPGSIQQIVASRSDPSNRSGWTEVPRELLRTRHDQALETAREAYRQASTDRQRTLAREQVEALESTTQLL